MKLADELRAIAATKQAHRNDLGEVCWVELSVEWKAADRIKRLEEALRRLVDRDLAYIDGHVFGGQITYEDVKAARAVLEDK